jgi:hypothetical protein
LYPALLTFSSRQPDRLGEPDGEMLAEHPEKLE